MRMAYVAMSVVVLTISVILAITESSMRMTIGEYEDTIEQQNDSSNVKIFKQEHFIDSLKNELLLTKTKVFTKTDTIFIQKVKVESIEVVTTDSSRKYSFADSLEYPRFKLNIRATLLLDINGEHGSFGYKYVRFPDTIEVSTILNKKEKLLYSVAMVNNIKYESKTNMFEPVYRGIYDELMGTSRPYTFWDRINVSAGIGYNFRGEILPTISIGYGINLREIRRMR